MWKFLRGPSRFKFDCRKRYWSDAVTNRTCNNNDDGFRCFVPGAVIDLGRLVCPDCGRRTPLRYSAPPLHLGPSPTTNWNRVREKSSFVTLFNLGCSSLPSLLRSNTSSERKVRRRSVREVGLSLLLTSATWTTRVRFNTRWAPRQCHRSMDGFLLQKQEASRESLSVASQERPQEAGVEVSEECTL